MYINRFDILSAQSSIYVSFCAPYNDPARKYKEVWIGLGGVQSAVYATETSVEEYLTYTTEETEKLEVTQMTEKLGGNMEQAIRVLAKEKKKKK